MQQWGLTGFMRSSLLTYDASLVTDFFIRLTSLCIQCIKYYAFIANYIYVINLGTYILLSINFQSYHYTIWATEKNK